MPLLSTLANASANGFRTFISTISNFLPSSWSLLSTASTQAFLGAVYADLTNAKYFAFGGSSTGGSTTNYQYSADGSSWSNANLPASYEWGASATDGSMVVVFPSGATVAGPSVAYTTNGTTWSTASLPYTGTAYRVTKTIWDGSQFLAITSSTGTQGLLYSSNGTSWSGIDIGNGGTSIAYDGSGVYVATQNASTSTGRRCTSSPTSSGNWANITFPSTRVWNCVVYGNGVFVAFAAGVTDYATSTNGSTWTSRTLPEIFSDGTSETAATAVFAYEKFWYYHTDDLYSSEDGITWTLENTFTSSLLDNLNGWAIGPDKMFGFGDASSTSGSDKYIKGV